jgi:hypothetical protein
MARSRSGLSAAIAALVAISLGVPAAHAAAAPVEAARVAPPTIHITMNNHGIPTTDDPFDFRPGLIRVSVSGNSNCPVWFIRLHDGYTFSEFRHDQYAMFDGDRAARQRLWDNSDYRGGLPGRAGQTVTGTLTLPIAGTYVIASYPGLHLSRPIGFELTGDPQDRGTADYDSAIVATSAGEWGGDTQLSTTGTLRFTNNDSVPHSLLLQPVVDGTTLEQVREWFIANPFVFLPPWLTPGPRLGMMPLDPGASETRAYTDYAPGTYLALDGTTLDYPPTMLAIVHIGD